MKARTYNLIVTASAFFILVTACKSSETVVREVPEPRSTTRIIDDNFILLNDAFSLRNGMAYSEVKSLLKIDPYQVYSNIEDNCIILKYLGKRQLRKHVSEYESPVPMEFYPSNSTKALTYGEPFEMFVVLDGADKKVRSYFMNVDVNKSIEAIELLERAKLVCDKPGEIRDMMLDWYYK